MSAINSSDNSAGRVDEFTVAMGFVLGHGVGRVYGGKRLLML